MASGYFHINPNDLKPGTFDFGGAATPFNLFKTPCRLFNSFEEYMAGEYKKTILLDAGQYIDDSGTKFTLSYPVFLTDYKKDSETFASTESELTRYDIIITPTGAHPNFNYNEFGIAFMRK